ncbi:MAG: hypothetical protein QGI95_03895 [Dehalococcoidales bacterium]|jgi:hypothetical protein|nr:hypothetical protein [Dehalococcoidales bacterium]
MAEEKTYRCLNPIGIQDAVDTIPLAKRLDHLNGKTIHLSICGEADIWVPLEKKFKMEYPDVNWTVKKRYHIVPMKLSEEERKTTDAVILGVCW